MYISNGDGYLRYELDFNGGTNASIPITTDITDTIGERDVYIEITRGNEIIGKTNAQTFCVENCFSLPYAEIPKRDELLSEISLLNESLSDKTSALSSIKNALIIKHCDITDSTPVSQYSDFISTLTDPVEFMSFLGGSLTEFYVPAGTAKLRDYLFAGMTQLSSVIMPESVTEIGNYTFSRCTGLTSFSIPSNITKIGHYAFSECSSLTGEIVLPSGLTFLGSRAFERTHITSINVPSTITTIPYGCFQESWLRTVFVSHGVVSLGSDAFYGCSSLATVYLPNTLTDNANQLFRSSNNLTCVVLENEFNASVNLSRGQYSVDTIIAMLNALADRTGLTAKTLTLGQYNLSKLTSEQIAIATNKNWNLA